MPTPQQSVPPMSPCRAPAPPVSEPGTINYRPPSGIAPLTSATLRRLPSAIPAHVGRRGGASHHSIRSSDTIDDLQGNEAGEDGEEEDRDERQKRKSPQASAVDKMNVILAQAQKQWSFERHWEETSFFFLTPSINSKAQGMKPNKIPDQELSNASSFTEICQIGTVCRKRNSSRI